MRTVQCRKHGKELPGLDAPPMPGPLGEDIYDNVSAKAWQEWQELQTMLINEHHLSLRDSDSRKYLLDQMNRFLRNEETETPAGYVKPED
ncbi:MAG: oxidative damage protection protein [Gammaproteobacteria bacterium]|nr:oxidative damage protection protein [Gammaproteobacteria bacterium]